MTRKLTASVSKTIGSLLSTTILYLLGFGAPKDEMLQWKQSKAYRFLILGGYSHITSRKGGLGSFHFSAKCDKG